MLKEKVFMYPTIRYMKTRLDFADYIQLSCQYAYMEYDFGIQTEFALFQLDEYTVEMLGLCWVSWVSVPDAANLIASRVRTKE
jgi:hypothetical protein